MQVYLLELQKSGHLRLSHQFVGPQLRFGTGVDPKSRFDTDALDGHDSVCLNVVSSGVEVLFGTETSERQGSSSALHPLDQWLAFGDIRLRVSRAVRHDGSPIRSGIEWPAWVQPELRIRSPYHTQVVLLADSIDSILIGASDVQADVLIRNDVRVSARHLRITRHTTDAPTVEDMDSRHGTFVNDERLTDARALQHGDQIQIGSTLIEYVCYADVIGLKRESTAMERGSTSESDDISDVGDEDIGFVTEEASAVVTTGPSATPVSVEGTQDDREEFDAAGLLVEGHIGSVLIIATAVLMCLLVWMTAQIVI